MAPIVMLTVVTGLLAAAWRAPSRWRQAPALGAHSFASVSHAGRTMGLTAALAVFVLAGPMACYLWLGEPAPADAQAVRPAAKTKPLDARDALLTRSPRDEAVANTEARVALMVDHLAQRMKSRPNDADGWQTLGRSYATLGRHAQAVEAFRTAARLRPNDATLLAEYAYSAAVTDPLAASGQAQQLIARALQLDPKNAKALALAGTLAVDRKDYQGAVQHWEQLALVEPADGPGAKELQASILQARRLALTRAGAASAALLAAPRGQIGGTVTLSPALAASVGPDDTVFVFARSPSGPRMPLAVLRKQVKDLPLRFTLDDSLATAPGAKLSSAANVVVGARVARSNSPFARDGDLQGLLASVPVGRGDLKIEINEVVRMR